MFNRFRTPATPDPLIAHLLMGPGPYPEHVEIDTICGDTQVNNPDADPPVGYCPTCVSMLIENNTQAVYLYTREHDLVLMLAARYSIATETMAAVAEMLLAGAETDIVLAEIKEAGDSISGLAAVDGGLPE